MGEKYLHVNFWSSYILFLPSKNHFREVSNPPRVPKFCRAWLIWSPAPTCMTTLWFWKKIQPSYRIWFILFFLSHTLFFFFCVIWPIFGYPKPNMKWFLSHLQPATEFHNLAVEWAQNWPLLMSLEAICNFFPLQRGQKSVFWGFLVFFKAIA